MASATRSRWRSSRPKPDRSPSSAIWFTTTTVLADLRARGIAIAHDAADVKTQTVMVTAHGASERALASTRALGLDVVEATCPLVHVAHRAVHALVRDGYHPVIVGQRDHVEVRGLTEDLDEFDVVLDETRRAGARAASALGIAAQTTQPIDKVRHLVALIQTAVPGSDVRFIDTVCQPDQATAERRGRSRAPSDVVIVIGGANSNNTRELVETCRHYCSRVHHVQTERGSSSGVVCSTAETVGITAGTSTPDDVIDRVERRIREFAQPSAAMSVRRGGSASMSSFARAHARWLVVVAVRRRDGMGRVGDRLLSPHPASIGLNPTSRIRCRSRACSAQVELVREAATLVDAARRSARSRDGHGARVGAIRRGLWRLGHLLLRVPAQ